MPVILRPIEKNPDICGGDACIGGTRIPVWVIEQCRRLGMSVREILVDYPSIQRDDILSAWEYAAVNRIEIDQQIRENADT
jgi:uncharacterized protein (DUF433 family)